MYKINIYKNFQYLRVSDTSTQYPLQQTYFILTHGTVLYMNK